MPRDIGVASRLVRHQAALIGLSLVALAACGKRGCARVAGYAPEIAVADLDPLSFDVRASDEQRTGRVTFALGKLGKPGQDDVCSKLPDETTVTLNGVRGTIESLGGATSQQIVNTNCKHADISWREVPLASEPTSKLSIDDGKTKLECALTTGLPLRLTTPSVKAAGDSVTLIAELSATGATISLGQVQVGADGEIPLMSLEPSDVRAEGPRVTFSVPTKWLPKAGNYRLVVDAAIQTVPTCSPARKTPVATLVHVRPTFPFAVTR